METSNCCNQSLAVTESSRGNSEMESKKDHNSEMYLDCLFPALPSPITNEGAPLCFLTVLCAFSLQHEH